MTKIKALPKAQPPGGLARGANSRQVQRALGRATPSGRPVKQGTGVPAHVMKWRQEARVRKHLEKITTIWLAEQLTEKGGRTNHSIARTLFALAKSYPNAWDLSQADVKDLLNVDGVAKVGLRHLEGYLTEKQVALKWTAGR